MGGLEGTRAPGQEAGREQEAVSKKLRHRQTGSEQE